MNPWILSINIKNFLAIRMLAWRGRLHYINLTWLITISVKVPMGGIVCIHNPVVLQLAVISPMIGNAMGDRQNVPLTKEPETFIPGRIRIEDLSVTLELICSSNGVHPCSTGETASTADRAYIRPNIVNFCIVLSNRKGTQPFYVPWRRCGNQAPTEFSPVAL